MTALAPKTPSKDKGSRIALRALNVGALGVLFKKDPQLITLL